MPDGGAIFLQGWQEGFRPDPILSVWEWADRKRVLSQKSSSEPGPWRTDRVPYAREIMACLSDDHPASEIIFMSSTQVSKTEIGLNWLGYTIDNSPAPMLAVLPTIDVGSRWSKQRVAPMIAESPALSAKVAPARSRDSGNTTTVKEFDGGLLIIGGANSAASLSSMPIKKLLLDEVDRYPIEVENEGDPVDIAEARVTTFPRHKIYKCSSPTIESLSRINKDWKRSDQRRYFVPCPHCNEKQHLKWDNLQWDEGKPEEARYACEHCGALIEEHQKTWMLEGGEWRATFPERGVVGFHINALYTPLGLGKRWGAHAKRYDEVKRDPVRLKVFVNTVLGECYEDPNEKLDWEEIKGRAEPYALRTVPVGCLLISAGVDVQKDRLEVEVDGWGRGEQNWTLDHFVIPGDPTRPEVWKQLDEYLARPLRNAWGIDMRIRTTGVDAGYLTDDVLNYTRARRNRGVFAVKGHTIRGKSILGRPNKVDVNWKGVAIKKGADLWMVGGDSAKHRLFARLAGDRKAALATDRMVHFSHELSDDYFMQLTAEVYDPNKRAWVKLHNRRNEALDIKVYAMAAAMHPLTRVHVIREHEWAKLEAVLQPASSDLFSAPAGAVAQPEAGGKDVAPEDAAPGGDDPPPGADASPPVHTSAPEQPAASGLFNARRAPRSNWVTGFRS